MDQPPVKLPCKVRRIHGLDDQYIRQGRVYTCIELAPTRNHIILAEAPNKSYKMEFFELVEEVTMEQKPSNPKDSFGSKKYAFSVVPQQVIRDVSLGLLDGATKYGRYNYRAVGVRSSIYFDATMRHLTEFWEGQDIDPDSQLHHITKAISSLIVWRDAMLNGVCEDDRPPSTKRNEDHIKECNAHAARLIADRAGLDVKHYTVKDTK